MAGLIIFAVVLGIIWFIIGTCLFIDCEDLPYAWPYFALRHLLRNVPGFNTRYKCKEAYKQGRYDMRNYGSLTNPANGRKNKEYMSSKNERIYDAYIKGGHEILAEKAEEAAGISLAQLRALSLQKSDEARIKQVEAMKQARKEMLTAPTDKWQTEFERITR